MSLVSMYVKQFQSILAKDASLMSCITFRKGQHICRFGADSQKTKQVNNTSVHHTNIYVSLSICSSNLTDVGCLDCYSRPLLGLSCYRKVFSDFDLGSTKS